MRISKLDIHNFRGFESAQIDFGQSNVSVFIGTNGQLTTAVPTIGISQSAGVAIDDMNFRIEFGDVTILN